MSVGPEGLEPTPTWLKARDAAVTPQPESWLGISVCIAGQSTSCCSCWFGFEIQVVVLGIELSAAVLSGPLGQPALDYRSQVGHLGVEPRPSCSQSRRAAVCISARWYCQSERPDYSALLVTVNYWLPEWLDAGRPKWFVSFFLGHDRRDARSGVFRKTLRHYLIQQVIAGTCFAVVLLADLRIRNE